jgi:hypothetical protein
MQFVLKSRTFLAQLLDYFRHVPHWFPLNSGIIAALERDGGALRDSETLTGLGSSTWTW